MRKLVLFSLLLTAACIHEDGSDRDYDLVRVTAALERHATFDIDLRATDTLYHVDPATDRGRVGVIRETGDVISLDDWISIRTSEMGHSEDRYGDFLIGNSALEPLLPELHALVASGHKEGETCCNNHYPAHCIPDYGPIKY